MRLRLNLACGVAMIIVSACAVLGIEQPQTFTERLAYANGQVTAIAKSTSTSLDAGRIDTADARYVLALTKESAAMLDAAQVASGAGDLTTAQGRLQLAQGILEKLEAYLASKERRQ